MHQRGLKAFVTVIGIEHRLGDQVIGVMADQIHQLARPHTKTCAAQSTVDLQGLARLFLQQRQRLGVIRSCDPVDDETRRRARMHRRLAPAPTQFEDQLRHARISLGTRHHLDQFHQRHRIEEMHADQTLRVAHAIGQRGDADRRGIGRDDRAFGQQGVELAQQLLLGLEFFDDHLDHQRGILQLGRRTDRHDAAQQRSAISSRHAALAHQHVKCLADLHHCRGRRALAHIGQQDLVSGLRRDLRDASAHDAGTDNAHQRRAR